jgi:RNA polymerase sigma factor (sigma-70 family)
MGGTETGEVDLWVAAREDPEARARVAELTLGIARRELGHRGAAPADLEDLAQETVRVTLVCLERGLEAPRELRAFLKYRAWGVLSDHRKRMRLRTPIPEPVEGRPEPMAETPGPERRASAVQLKGALAACRDQLSPALRDVLVLRYDQHLDAATMAERQGVHRNTINVRVFRALQALRECLTRKGFDAGDLTA